MLLHRQRHEHFGYLALDGLLLGEVLVLRQLLGDGAAAFHDGARFEVVHEGARRGDGVEAGMGVEPMILHGHDGLQVQVRQLVDGRERLAALDGCGHLVEAGFLDRFAVQVEPACKKVHFHEHDEDERRQGEAPDERDGWMRRRCTMRRSFHGFHLSVEENSPLRYTKRFLTPPYRPLAPSLHSCKKGVFYQVNDGLYF